MAKIGRNDPCHCGSGKKYKHCHLPIEEAERSGQMRMRRGVEGLVPKLIDVAQNMPEQVGLGLGRYWDGKYQLSQLGELDEKEDRGADRFLTWFAFDYVLDDGKTLVEKLIEDPSELDLEPVEATLLPTWGDVRLRSYEVIALDPGRGLTMRDLLTEEEYLVEDQAASRRMLLGEVLVGHLVPTGKRYHIAGAAAHLTEDTRTKLRGFMQLHLETLQRENPELGWNDLIRSRSEVVNHFVMQLPVEEPDPELLERILEQTRAALQLQGIDPDPEQPKSATDPTP
ncbi:MAG: SEC-C domain-containing protein [Roseiflexaceae bacterium]